MLSLLGISSLTSISGAQEVDTSIQKKKWSTTKSSSVNDVSGPISAFGGSIESRTSLGNSRWSKEIISLKSAVDNFEDGDVSEYGFTHNVTFETTTNSKEGTYAGQWTNGGTHSWVASLSGLDSYPGPGDAPFYGWVKESTSTETSLRMNWAAQSTGTKAPNGYFLQVNPSYDELALRRGNGDGSADTDIQTTASQPLQTGVWYKLRVAEWTSGGNITGELYDSSGNKLASVSTTDDTYGKGGIGWGSYEGTPHTARFDGFYIE